MEMRDEDDQMDVWCFPERQSGTELRRRLSVEAISDVARGGGTEAMPPKLLVTFSPINLHRYIILGCKWSLDGATFLVQ